MPASRRAGPFLSTARPFFVMVGTLFVMAGPFFAMVGTQFAMVGTLFVMVGLGPTIHDFGSRNGKSWMPAPRAGMTRNRRA